MLTSVHLIECVNYFVTEYCVWGGGAVGEGLLVYMCVLFLFVVVVLRHEVD